MRTCPTPPPSHPDPMTSNVGATWNLRDYTRFSTRWHKHEHKLYQPLQWFGQPPLESSLSNLVTQENMPKLFLEDDFLLFSHHTPNKCCYHKIFYYDYICLMIIHLVCSNTSHTYLHRQPVAGGTWPSETEDIRQAIGRDGHRTTGASERIPSAQCWHTEHEQVAWQNMMRHVVSWFCTLYNLTRWIVSPNSPTNCFNSCPARDIKYVTQTSSLQPVLIWFLPNTETVGSWDKEHPPTESSEY